jgi:hypothetical protein
MKVIKENKMPEQAPQVEPTPQETAEQLLAAGPDQMIPDSNLPPAQTSMRADYWKPATPEQIANANKYGFDLAANNAKYHTGQSVDNKK